MPELLLFHLTVPPWLVFLSIMSVCPCFRPFRRRDSVSGGGVAVILVPHHQHAPAELSSANPACQRSTLAFSGLRIGSLQGTGWGHPCGILSYVLC